jgi:hypothetical protein
MSTTETIDWPPVVGVLTIQEHNDLIKRGILSPDLVAQGWGENWPATTAAEPGETNE